MATGKKIKKNVPAKTSKVKASKSTTPKAATPKAAPAVDLVAPVEQVVESKAALKDVKVSVSAGGTTVDLGTVEEAKKKLADVADKAKAAAGAGAGVPVRAGEKRWPLSPAELALREEALDRECAESDKAEDELKGLQLQLATVKEKVKQTPLGREMEELKEEIKVAEARCDALNASLKKLAREVQKGGAPRGGERERGGRRGGAREKAPAREEVHRRAPGGPPWHQRQAQEDGADGHPRHRGGARAGPAPGPRAAGSTPGTEGGDPRGRAGRRRRRGLADRLRAGGAAGPRPLALKALLEHLKLDESDERNQADARRALGRLQAVRQGDLWYLPEQLRALGRRRPWPPSPRPPRCPPWARCSRCATSCWPASSRPLASTRRRSPTSTPSRRWGRPSMR